MFKCVFRHLGAFKSEISNHRRDIDKDRIWRHRKWHIRRANLAISILLIQACLIDGLNVLKTAVKNVGLPYLKSPNDKVQILLWKSFNKWKQYTFVWIHCKRIRRYAFLLGSLNISARVQLVWQTVRQLEKQTGSHLVYQWLWRIWFNNWPVSLLMNRSQN